LKLGKFKTIQHWIVIQHLKQSCLNKSMSN
jgi:hypothetical protein